MLQQWKPSQFLIGEKIDAVWVYRFFHKLYSHPDPAEGGDVSIDPHFQKLIDNRPVGGYRMIMADPPWAFELFNEETGKEKSAQNHYDCMSIEDIQALPVGALAAKNSLLWLWATNPMLKDGIATLEAWGFEYVTAGSWLKRYPDKKPKKCGCIHKGGMAWGTGYVLRSTNEPFLIGRRGRVKTARNVPSGFEGVRREHSRKPEIGFKYAEQLLNDHRRIELFSRQARPGWAGHGDQATKFNDANLTDMEENNGDPISAPAKNGL